MALKFFEDYLDKLYNEKVISTPDPDLKGNVLMCCPFPHTKDGHTYYEQIPSSSINLDMRCFHCFVCDRSLGEVDFACAVTNKTKEEIIKEFSAKEELTNMSKEWRETQHQALLDSQETLDSCHYLNISDEVIEELSLGFITNCLATPVFKNGQLVNVARYNIHKIEGVNKVRYNSNSLSGDIVPFDIWKTDRRHTIFCEGEKDMLVARSFGLNAITITGGSQSAIQKEYLPYFRNRIVYICYDNDEAGRKGAIKLYKDLLSNGADVYIVDISQVCVEEKEDVSDFFNKYHKTREDFDTLITSTKRKLTDKELNAVETKNTLKLSKLEDNIKNSVLYRSALSKLQVIATSTEVYAVPEYATFKPKQQEDMQEDSIKNWFLFKDSSFLELMEGKVQAKDINGILARLCGLSPKWYEDYTLDKGHLKSIYKLSVCDRVTDEDEKAIEYSIDLYSFQPLDIGKYYEIEYKLFPHPKMGQHIIGIAYKITPTEFTFDFNNTDNLRSLDKFKVTTTIADKVDELYKNAKVHIAPYLKKDLWLLSDLVFNSPLEITYNKVMRGALDVFILGDTRTGKSETTRSLRELYQFGEVVPLKTATVASLIGGTDEKSKKTKLGVLPRFNQELVILEEFSGAPLDFLKTLTEIRSSNIIKIYRVSGDIKAPCKLRMITISNPISENGNLMSLASYPNGVQPLNELIKSPEDIARYDAFLLVPAVGKLTNPFLSKTDNTPGAIIDGKDYVIKSRWIKSLKAEDIVIDNAIGNYIFEQAQELNKVFESSFTVFGSETDKKVARFASALACMLVSSYDYKHIIVTKDHVDYVISFIKSIYDNECFKLKEFAQEERAHNKATDKDVQILEKYYSNNATFVDLLANNSRISRLELTILSGADNHKFSVTFNEFIALKFIRVSGDQVLPTPKFRDAHRRMHKVYDNRVKDEVLEGETIF